MEKYTSILNKKGRLMWFKNGKICAKKDVPQELIEAKEIMETDNPNDVKEFEEAVEKLEKEVQQPQPADNANRSKGCIFCGAPVEHQRTVFVEGKSIDALLCHDCYYDKTYGEVSAKVKEKGE